MARVLLADDDMDIRELVRFKLTLSGHEVTAVADGSLAWAACHSDTFDAAVFDVQMPGMTGLELVRAIRASAGAVARLPIMLLTAMATESDERLGREAGANDYLTKPFTLLDLANRVQALVAPTG